MRIYLDNQPLDSDALTVAGGIATAREAAHAEGRVIIEAKLDGRTLLGTELASTDQAGEELRLVSANPRALVAASLREVADGMAEVRAAQAEAAGLLQSGEYEPAFARMGEAIGGWENVRRVIDEGPRLLGVDATPLPLGRSRTVGGAIEALSASLTNLQSAVRVQDWSTLADVLEADLDDSATEWGNLLVSLADHLSANR
jgi:hypothetical protein